MKIVQTLPFQKAVKKLHPNQKSDLYDAIAKIAESPAIGKAKTGDLTGLMVYKFKMQKQLTLLSYTYDDDKIILTLLLFGSRENFYKQLKRQIKGD